MTGSIQIIAPSSIDDIAPSSIQDIVPASVVVSREVALRGFYFWCDDAGVARSFDFPDVRRVDDKLLEMME